MNQDSETLKLKASDMYATLYCIQDVMREAEFKAKHGYDVDWEKVAKTVGGMTSMRLDEVHAADRWRNGQQ